MPNTTPSWQAGQAWRSRGRSRAPGGVWGVPRLRLQRGIDHRPSTTVMDGQAVQHCGPTKFISDVVQNLFLSFLFRFWPNAQTSDDDSN